MFVRATLALLLALALLGLPAFAPAQAAQLVMIEEDGCPWCARWHDEIGPIYPKTAEGKTAPLRRIDIHDDLPTDLAWLTKGGFTPTFVLIHEGKELGRIRGFPGEDHFWGLLGRMVGQLPEDMRPEGLR